MILGLVCARAGSKGVPGKNVREMCGKPLLQWSVDQALSCLDIEKVVVSSDGLLEIAGPPDRLDLVGRPAFLAGDTVPKWDVWTWVLSECPSVTAIVDLDPTQPLRTVEDVVGCIALWRETRTVVAGIAPTGLSPYYDLVERAPSGALFVSKGGGAVRCRQDLPPCYMQSGIYVVSRHALETRQHLFDGVVYGYEMPRERAFDINDETDWQIVEMLMGRTGAISG